jgi:phosphate transport system substrate-binding protein
VSIRRAACVAGAILVLVAAGIGFLRVGTDDNAGASAGTSGVRPGDIPCGRGVLAGAGSTFAKNIELQWVQDYLRACPATSVNYNATGSGAGIQAFIDGQVDFAGSDSLMKSDEQALADSRCGGGNRAIQLPITAGALVFTFNLPGVESLRLSPSVISDLFQGRVARWDDPRVAADNPGVRLPRIPVQAVHRSDSSGTTDVFSRYVAAAAGEGWQLGTGKELRWPAGQAAKGSDGVTVAVKSAPGAITYMEESFAKANQLGAAQLRNGAGEYVAPEPGPVSAALAAATSDTSKNDLRVSVNFTSPTAGIYPASAVTYAIVCNSGNTNPSGLRAFLGYAVSRGQQSAGPLGYAPLPATLANRVPPLISRIR